MWAESFRKPKYPGRSKAPGNAKKAPLALSVNTYDILVHYYPLRYQPIIKYNLLFFLCDEIFSKSLPILITVEPISSAILRIELADTRKAEDWKKHWKCLEENGYYAIYLVSDEGIGICTAHKEALADIIRQPDTYHAIAHQLGHWVDFLENAAYKAIKEEYDRYDKIDSAFARARVDKIKPFRCIPWGF